MTGMRRLGTATLGARAAALAILLAALLAMALGLGACAADDGAAGPIILPGDKDATEDVGADVGPGVDVAEDAGVTEDIMVDAGQDVADAGADVATDTGPGPDIDQDTGGDPDIIDTDTGPKVDCELAADCAGKLGALGECDQAACVEGACVKQTVPAPTCCAAAADCDDGNACTTDTCPTKGGVCIYESDPTCCTDSGTYLDAGFEGGAPQGFTVTDTDDVDAVTWSLTKNRAHDGSWSWYFGNPTCKTYYGGGLSAACVPTDEILGDNKVASGTLTSPEVALPASGVFYLTWRVWSETEAIDDPTLPLCKPGGPLLCYNPDFESFVDALTVYVDDGVTKSVLWNSAALNKKTILENAGKDDEVAYFLKTSDGVFALIGADLSPWAGKSVRLQFSFTGSETLLKSYYLRAELPEGIYIDNVRIESGCGAKTCTSDTNCKSSEACVVEDCTDLSNASGGVCFWEADKSCKLCPGGTAAECSDGNDCTTDACKSGQCTNTPIAGCCKAAELAKTGFESAVLPTGWTASGSGATTWHTSKSKPFAGAWSLWFGNDATGTYDDPGKTPKGSVSSGPIAIPASAEAAVAAFQLYLSTEWNAGIPPAYGEAEYDILTLDVLDATTGALLPFTPQKDDKGQPTGSTYFWDSYAIGGTTGALGAPIYLPVTVNLTEFKGKTVKLRFSFDAGDSSSNSHGGAHIDQLVVQTTCGAKLCQVTKDCGAPASDCETIQCSGGLCVTTLLGEDCCASASDCDDGNPCTIDTCTANECSSVDDGDTGCCFEKASLLDGFEDDPGEWAFFGEGSVGWSFLDGEATAHAGAGALYFGDPLTMNYDDGFAVQGLAISQEFLIPSGGTSILSFWLKLSTEFDDNDWFDALAIDRLTISAIPNDGAAVIVWDSSLVKGTTGGEWDKIELSLAAVAGKTVRLQFEFDSLDANSNGYMGVLIDELSFSVACVDPDCFSDGDCPDDGDPCTIEECTAGTCGFTESNEGACCKPTDAASESFDLGVQGSLGEFSVDQYTCDGPDSSAVCTTSAAAPVKWQVNGAQKHSGNFSLYFGSPNSGSYDDAGKRVTGIANSGALTLAADAGATLDLWTWVDVEPWSPILPALDRYEIAVVDGDGVETVVWAKSALGEEAAAYKKWTNVQVPLDAWAGEEIHVRFTFDSDDGLGNTGVGIFVDDFRLIQGCPVLP